MQKTKIKWIVGFSLIGSIVLLLLSGIKIESTQKILSLSNRTAPILFVLIGSLALTLLVPKTPVSVFSGAVFGWKLGTALMLAVALIAAVVNYYLGSYFFRSTVIHAASSNKYKLWLPVLRLAAETANTKSHFLVRLTPIPTAFISYIMGAMGSRIRPFLMGTALAVLPQSLWVNVGANSEIMDSGTINTMKLFSLCVSIGAAILASTWISRRVRKELKAID